MLKRKYSSRRCNDETNSDNQDDKIKDLLLDGLFSNVLSNNKRIKHKHDEVYREHNHIFFRCDVNIQNCDLLLGCIREFEEEIKTLKTDPYITEETFTPPKLYIHITTYGGDLYAAFMVYDTIKSSKVKIVTISEGYVASAGTVMAIGASHRQIQKSCVMMIHQLRTVIGGKYDEIEEDFKNSTMDMARLVNIYHKEFNGKMSKKEIKEVLTHDVWWDATKCLQKGLCHEIL